MSVDDYVPMYGPEGRWAELRRERDEARAEVERLREAIEQACYALDPNQGERPSPSLAYEWLRTTFPADHPNYVAREALEAGER